MFFAGRVVARKRFPFKESAWYEQAPLSIRVRGNLWQWLDAARVLRHTAGMTSTLKIAVSLPKQVAERARRAVRRGHAPSVSAYVSSALEEKVKLDELATLLSQMLAESGGPLTAAERRAADRALGVTKKPARRRAKR